MANAREIKLRIKGINETKKITKAMKLISAAKLKKARAMHDATLPFFRKIQQTMATIIERLPEIDSAYFDTRDNKEHKVKAYIVIASDKGLNGGYNHNIAALAQKMIDKEKSIVFPIGKVVKESLERCNYNISNENGVKDYNVDVDTARDIANYMIKLFKEEKIDELHLIYTEMENAISLKPKTLKILPLNKEDFEHHDNIHEKFEFEPTPELVFDVLAAKYVKGIVYGGMVEAFVSEHSARMNAMDNATTNAEKMIKKLTLNYNRARQAAITQEITEIVSGAANI